MKGEKEENTKTRPTLFLSAHLFFFFLSFFLSLFLSLSSSSSLIIKGNKKTDLRAKKEKNRNV
jgi:hypothetical protein